MKITVGTKIGAGFSLSLIILLIIGISSYTSINRTNDSVQISIHTYKVLQELEGVLSSLKDAETGQRGFIITGESKYLAPYNSAVTTISQELKDLRDLTSDNMNQQRRLDNLEPLITKKFNELNETIALRKNKGFQSAKKVVSTDIGKQVMDDIRNVIGKMENEENSLLKARFDRMQSNKNTTIAIIIYGISFSFFLLAIVGFLITRNISKPLKEITSSAKQISSGELMVNVSYSNRSDEVGLLAQAFSKMVQSLQGMADVAKEIAGGNLSVSVIPQSENDVLGNAFTIMIINLQRLTKEILEGVNVLSSSASEILASTTQVASSSAESATAVSQTTATIEEVKQTAQLSSQKAKYVSETSQKAAQVSVNGKKSVELSIEGMNRVQTQKSIIAENIVRLSEQSQAIGEIVTTVNDLADQSNLLAVNAAIEAAKAGEQGKGFTVVAQEVKNLAEQSKQATNQIRTILSDIQKAMSTAVLSTEQGTKAVEAGVKQSMEAGESIQVLSDSISEVAQAAVQIAASSKQQSVGMDQVTMAMENIKLASTQNVAGTKQSEAAAQNLHNLGQKLKELVERFKV
ncbi:MAG: methyl-accepting chemotaxis protein [Ignavibacteriaceae bacterium]